MIIRLLGPLLGLLTLVLPRPVLAGEIPRPSFDCSEAAQAFEQAICRDTGLANQDHAVAEQFQRVLRDSPPETRPVISREQKEWLDRRSLCNQTFVNYTVEACLLGHYSDWLEHWPERLSSLSGSGGISFTLKIAKFPDPPILVSSANDTLCHRILDAVVDNYLSPNKIHFRDKEDGFVARLHVIGGNWVEWPEHKFAPDKPVSVVPIIRSDGLEDEMVLRKRYFSSSTIDYGLYIIPSSGLTALLNEFDGRETSGHIAPIVEIGTEYEESPIQVLQFEGDDYLVQEKDWSATSVSRVEPGGPLRPTCLLKYPDVPPISAVWQRWLDDLAVIQGDETIVSGTLHTLARLKLGTKALGDLALSRPADMVQFGLYPPVSPQSDGSLLQTRLHLAQWGLEGPWNHAKIRRLIADTDTAVAALANYYGTVYGVAANDADRAARIVADAIVLRSFSFNQEGAEDRKGKTAGYQIEESVRNLADEFARLPVDQRKATDATHLIRLAILAGASLSDVEALIAAGADLDNDSDREPAVFYSLERPEILGLLIRTGVAVDRTNSFGKTALMYAAQLDLQQAVELLINAHADVNAATLGDTGKLPWELYAISTVHRTALMYAAENAAQPVIDRLIDARADVRASDSMGNGISTYLDRNPILSKQEKDAIRARLN